ncbi:hypothetical protein BV898_07683 [Hypsibius exemplaris]|uniref:Odorant receptor n=1 Tax=Hypsibius exemplaris TaxID=2072580 RepID=A0A1W0WSY4_HYPEX|nr:hypothetical protein BV898_07683 [Hypsibius exemplaris]
MCCDLSLKHSHDSCDFSTPLAKEVDAERFLAPLTRCLHYLGWLDYLPKPQRQRKDPEQDPPEGREAISSGKIGATLLKAVRVGYLVVIWTWTVVISINSFCMSLMPEKEPNNSHNPVNDSIPHGNVVITLLELMPFAFISIRNAGVLTLFTVNAQHILIGIQTCDIIRRRLHTLLGQGVTFERYVKRPVVYILLSVVIVVLFEVHEWSVWFNTYDGLEVIWDFRPFPVKTTQLQYAYFWWAFTSIPFMLAQLTLCVPVMFAYVLRRFVRTINKELGLLSTKASQCRRDEEKLEKLSAKLSHLRTAHYEVSQLTVQLDSAVNGMLIVQFLFDIVVLFGFVGLLVNAKDSPGSPGGTGRVPVLEWTFYIPASFMWFFILLFVYCFPMIHLSEEGEKTHALVHAMTFASPALFQCCALLASYLTVLTEILDRHYGTMELRRAIANLTEMIQHDRGALLPSHQPHTAVLQEETFH